MEDLTTFSIMSSESVAATPFYSLEWKSKSKLLTGTAHTKEYVYKKVYITICGDKLNNIMISNLISIKTEHS